jgi:hypothetical protein
MSFMLAQLVLTLLRRVTIRFAQSPPLLTYIAGPKGETLHLSIESSILGSLHSFNFFFFGDGPIKLAHCNKRKLDL